MNLQRVNKPYRSDQNLSNLRIDCDLLKNILPIISEIKDEAERLMYISYLKLNSIPFVCSENLILTKKKIIFGKSNYYGQRPIEDDLTLTSSDFPNKGEITDDIFEIKTTNLFALKSDLPYRGDLIKDLFYIKTVYSNSFLLESLYSNTEHFYYKEDLIIPRFYR